MMGDIVNSSIEIGETPITPRSLFARMPKGWNDVEIYIANGIGDATKVRRISLHENSDGKKAVLLHEKQLEIKP